MTVVDARGNRNGTPGANSVGGLRIESAGCRLEHLGAERHRAARPDRDRDVGGDVAPTVARRRSGPGTPSTANRTVCERGQPAPVTWTSRGSSARSTVPGSAAIVQRPTVRVAVSTQPVSIMATCRRRTIGPVAAGSVTVSATKEPVALVTPAATC